MVLLNKKDDLVHLKNTFRLGHVKKNFEISLVDHLQSNKDSNHQLLAGESFFGGFVTAF